VNDPVEKAEAWIREEFGENFPILSRQHGDAGIQAEEDYKLIVPLIAEIKILRESLLTIRNAHLRISLRNMPDITCIGRDAWVEAFKPLIVPPYNRLKWEKTEPWEQASNA